MRFVQVFTYSYIYFYNCVVPLGFLQRQIRVAFPGESQLRQSRATQLRVHAGCFSVSIIHRTLTWTTGTLRCAQMLMHAVAHSLYGHCKRVCTESWPWEKNPLTHWGIDPVSAARRTDVLSYIHTPCIPAYDPHPHHHHHHHPLTLLPPRRWHAGTFLEVA